VSIDKYFSKHYDKQNYNCAHFVVDVYSDMFGEDLRPTLSSVLLPRHARSLSVSTARKFIVLESPENPCIVLMQRPRSDLHVGIWYNRRVLHLVSTGVHYQPLNVASYGFSKVRFIKC